MKIWPWSKLHELEERIRDMEKQFAIEFDMQTGKVTKTLADVPVEDREEMRKKKTLRRATWSQRQAVLEATDGFRRTSVFK